MVQKQADMEKEARLIFITHKVVNKNLYESIRKISRLEVVKKVLSIIRVEDLD
jgi:hypothetical protein